MKKYYFICIFMFFGLQYLSAQTTETFETETGGATSFTNNGQVFNITSMSGQTVIIQDDFPGLGWDGSGSDDIFIDNDDTQQDLEFSIAASGGNSFTLKSIYLYLSGTAGLGSIGSCTVTGKLNGVAQFSVSKSSPFFNTSSSFQNGFTLINMSTYGGSDNSNVLIDEYVVLTSGNYSYVSLDAMTWSYGNASPVFTSPNTANVAENTTAAMTVIATDADSDPVTYAITGGTDSGDFSINTNSGDLSFVVPPDFENPIDANIDNVYTVQVTASDATDITNQTINVTVTNVDDTAPVINSVSVPVSGTYTAGQNLDFTVNSSENVIVNTGGGSPRIVLAIGTNTWYAEYVSGSGTSALVFRYIVQIDDTDTDGIAVDAAIEANGGTIRDNAGNNLTLTLNSVGNTTGIFVDALAPAAPSTPDLAATSDDGISDTDNVTSDNTPTFTGTSEANATVSLISSLDGNLGITTADGIGNWSFTPGAALTENTHNITAMATDVAGNTGLASLALSVSIDASLYTYNNGVWTPQNPNGNITATDNVQVLSGTASFSQDVEFNNLTVAAGATLNVEDVLLVNGDIVNNGNLIFVSNASGTGQIGPISVGSTITGNVTVERYIPARRAFRFISSAVTTTSSIHANWQENATSNTDDPNPGYGTHITGNTTDQIDGFDGTPSGNPSLFEFDNAGQTWASVTNTNATTLKAGVALRLFVRGSRSIDVTDNLAIPTNTTLRAIGNLKTGNYTNATMSQVANAYNFIGNPYQAIIDINSVLSNSINLNSNHYYVWDPNLGTRGAYTAVSLPLGANASGSDANQFLQPGQGAFVQTAANGFALWLVGEGDKAVYETETNVFRPYSTQAFINIQLWEQSAYANTTFASDGLRVNFSSTGSNDVLSNDAMKLSNLDENIAIVNGTTYLSIEHRAMPVQGEVLSLFTDQYRFESYVFKIQTANLDGVTAYLQDDYLNQQTELTNNGITSIPINVDEHIAASVLPDRFSIVFGALMHVEDTTLEGFSIYPNPVQGTEFFMHTSLNVGEHVKIVVLDLLGKKVLQTMKIVPDSRRISINHLHIEPGIYLVNAEHNRKTYTEKLIVE